MSSPSDSLPTVRETRIVPLGVTSRNVFSIGQIPSFLSRLRSINYLWCEHATDASGDTTYLYHGRRQPNIVMVCTTALKSTQYQCAYNTRIEFSSNQVSVYSLTLWLGKQGLKYSTVSLTISLRTGTSENWFLKNGFFSTFWIVTQQAFIVCH